MKVWISRAMFERDTKEFAVARNIYEEADKYLKENSGSEERLMLLESWREMEQQLADPDAIDKVNKKMPKRVKKQRKIKIVEGD